MTASIFEHFLYAWHGSHNNPTREVQLLPLFHRSGTYRFCRLNTTTKVIQPTGGTARTQAVRLQIRCFPFILLKPVQIHPGHRKIANSRSSPQEKANTHTKLYANVRRSVPETEARLQVKRSYSAIVCPLSQTVAFPSHTL